MNQEEAKAEVTSVNDDHGATDRDAAPVSTGLSNTREMVTPEAGFESPVPGTATTAQGGFEDTITGLNEWAEGRQ